MSRDRITSGLRAPFTGGLVVAPRATRTVAAALTMHALADVLQTAEDKLLEVS